MKQACLGEPFITTEWIKHDNGSWWRLNRIDTLHPHFDDMDGVYVIWYGGSVPAVVQVGRGAIRDELATHQCDPNVQAYSHLDLYATWAAIPKEYQAGVEAYLMNHYRPKLGGPSPQATPLSVRLP